MNNKEIEWLILVILNLMFVKNFTSIEINRKKTFHKQVSLKTCVDIKSLINAGKSR